MSHSYVIVQRGVQIELLSGDFANADYGDKIDRDEKIYGPEPWIVVKKFNFDQREKLSAIEKLMGFTELMKLFKFDIR